MKCRQDAINYYANVTGLPLYIADVIRHISESHDFKTSGALVKGTELDTAFLTESAKHLGAAILQFLAHNYLEIGGYHTWAQVTRYYSRYFAILAFTRLAGYAILGIRLQEDKEPRMYWVIRVDENDHSYLISQRKQLNKARDILPITLPEGSGSHKTNLKLMAEVGKTWDRKELSEAQIPSPEYVSQFNIWDSYEDWLLHEEDTRSEWNYLTDFFGYFFAELDGLHAWKENNMRSYRTYVNPISDTSPDEDTYEAKMAWASIAYLFSILANTPAKRDLTFWLDDFLAKAPANEEMKYQVISELRTILQEYNNH